MSEFDPSSPDFCNSAQDPNGNKLPPITARREAFAAHFANPQDPAFLNRTKAAAAAGYRGDANTLAVTGHRIARSPKVWQWIRESLQRHGVTADLCAQVIRDGLSAKKQQCFPTKEGGVIYAESVVDYAERRHMLELVLRVEDKASAESTTAEPDVAAPQQSFAGFWELTPEEAREVEKVAQLPPAVRNAARDAISPLIDEFQRVVGDEARSVCSSDTAVCNTGAAGTSMADNNADVAGD